MRTCVLSEEDFSDQVIPVSPERLAQLRRLWAAAVPASDPRFDFRVDRIQAAASSELAEAIARERHTPRSRYERQLAIPPLSARTHVRGRVWREEEMCSAQWQQLQQIRAKERARRARKREHDRAVERELQIMTASPATPREPVAA
jgi:hypothetical protein